ncbi:hypothetical protein Mlaev_01719 [Microbacterium laevaniformans]|uniref:NAD-specific glutamate dehydrogenase n=1 Tax=Microbacterium laevaniformans TaxID=36807 RepID=A0A150HDW3_9MICO|nr:hypothetical protein Mlaev_01719 [Microbacterium laevaniformans]
MVLAAGAVVRTGAVGGAGSVIGRGCRGIRTRRGALGERRADRGRSGATATTTAGAGLTGSVGRGIYRPLGCRALRAHRLRLGRLGDAALGPRRDVQVGVQVRARRVRLDRLRLPELERPVDQGPLVQVVPVDEGDGDTRLARTAGASGAVQVGLLVVRDRVVDDVGHIVDVDSARRDVRRDEHVLLAGLERGHRPLARLLAHVAVHRARVEPAVVELVHQLLSGALGAGEDDRLAATLCLQDAGDHLILVERVRPVDQVLDVRLRQTLVGIGRPDVDRVAHEPACESDDRAGHCRGEQLGVTHRCDLLEDLLDVGQEAEIEHLVGLVEDDLDRTAQIEQTLVVEVDEAARRADHDLRAGFQLVDLSLVRLAAVDGDHARGAVLGEHVHVFVDLDGQLAGRNDDERLHTRRRVEAETLDDGDAEAEGLARSGLGLADDVLAGQPQRNRLLLNGEGVHDAPGGEGLHDVGIDSEFSECRHSTCLSGGEKPPVRKSTPSPHPQARGSRSIAET